MRVGRWLPKLVVLVLFGILVVYLTRNVWLRSLGAWLVRNDPPEKVEAIVVLGGDTTGVRIMKACELVRGGYATLVLVSGAAKFYRYNEADEGIEYARQHGCPTDGFVAAHLDALSTADEAKWFRGELQRRGIHKILIVTSNYHTARAARIFENYLGPGVAIRTAAAPDRYFSPEGWWQTREGQKTAFNEYCKAIAAAAGI